MSTSSITKSEGMEDECEKSSSGEQLEPAEGVHVQAVQGHDAVSEGGFDGWMTVIGVWCAQFVSLGHAMGFGVYESFYKENYLNNESSSAISRMLLWASTALYVFCNFILSITQPHEFYQIFLAQGIGMGIAMGAMYGPTLALIGQHFRTRHRALALGVASTGSSIGGFIAVIILNNLINRDGEVFGAGGTPASFQRAIKIHAGLNTGLLLLANSLIRETKSRDGSKSTSNVDLPGIFKDRTFVIVCMGTFIALWGEIFPVFYAQLLSITKGLSPIFSFYTLPIFNASSVAGRTVLPFFADRFGALNMLIPVTFISGGVCFGYLGVHTAAGDAIVTGLLGFCFGAWNSLLITTAADPARHQGEIGTRIGIITLCQSLSDLAGPPINGALLTDKFLWYRPIIFSGVSTLGGASLFLLARITEAQHKHISIQANDRAPTGAPSPDKTKNEDAGYETIV
ncbi:MFS general substrate transporter [Sistotremastrum niveocremeum HHB9708]|uniref:MFS general substrate transporter n=1 Tax=Sistotremastrum niveocremeum HHB9708 TaxID=1314777 RepID=A0A164T741_9AGAM|nr:MFS general substrate transporter [Sistotremastrum niveocremeum HHB9708]